MPNCAPVQTVDVCSRAAFRPAVLAALALAFAAPAAAQVTAPGSTIKIGFYNIQSGKGEPALPGRSTPFADTANCTDSTRPLNAWGIGFVQKVLADAIASDPGVIALGLAEAWTSVCASPENVRQALGWKARSASNNGLAIVARHGFSGSVTVLRLDTSQSTNLEPRYVTHARVCVDAACSSTFDVFATHMAASGTLRDDSMNTQVRQVLAFMAQQAGTRPRALLGDFNVYEEYEPTCGDSPWPASILDNLRKAGYRDAWRTLKGAAIGYTGMTNRPGCGSPQGSTYKRIDYAWSLGVTPVSVELFGVVPPGDPAPSDHYGILAEYAVSGSVPPPPDVTAPVTTVSSPLAGATVSGLTAVAATATDNVAVARVEFLVDGAVIGADTSAPYSVSWDTRLLTNATHSVQARAYDAAGNFAVSALRWVTVNNVVASPPPASSSLSWLNPVNVTASGTSLSKTSGCNGCGDAGAVTQQEVTTSGGYVEFVPTTGGRFFAGLSADRSASTATGTIQYAFSFWPSGGWDVRERGVYRKEGRFAAGDVFRIAVESGTVVYYHNGKAVYRSAVAPALPLALDTTFFTTGAGINAVTVSAGGASAPPPSSGGDVVLYAGRATLVGTGWQLAADSTAAGGAAVRYPDAGAGKASGALSAPPSYVELTFYAEAGRSYRLWMRGRADRDYWGNDSVFVQFSGSVDANGAAIWRIGTTSSTTYVLEDGTGAGLRGWGWQDNGYGALGPEVRFATTGTQKIRIQNREDGLSIDQIVLSSERYLTSAPGATKSDTTILSQ